MLSDVSDIFAIEAYGTTSNIVETVQQSEQCRLSRARFPALHLSDRSEIAVRYPYPTKATLVPAGILMVISFKAVTFPS